MSDWDFLWGLTGDDLVFAQENGYTKEETCWIFNDEADCDLYCDESNFDDDYIKQVTTRASQIKFRPINYDRCYADFEFNCTDKRNQRSKLEIISVGMVICDKNNDILEKFKAFVKPTKTSKLSDKCKVLTGICQNEIDEADDLETVCQKMLQLLNKYNIQKMFVWGNCDKFVMYNDAKLHKKAGLSFGSIEKIAKKIINIQAAITSQLQLHRSPSLANIAHSLEVFTEKEHDALEDARTLSEIIYTLHTEDVIDYPQFILFLAYEWKNAELNEIINVIGKENKEFAKCVYQALNETQSKQEIHNFLMRNISSHKKATELYKKIKPLLKDKS